MYLIFQFLILLEKLDVCVYVHACVRTCECVQVQHVCAEARSQSQVSLLRSRSSSALRQNLPLEPKNFPLDYLFNESRGFLSFSLPSPGLRSTYHHTQLMWYWRSNSGYHASHTYAHVCVCTRIHAHTHTHILILQSSAISIHDKMLMK